MSSLWIISTVVLWIFLLALAFLVFVLYRQVGLIYLGRSQGVSRDGIAEGSQAPDFTAPDLNGVPHRLADYRGQRLLLIFGSPNCRPCQQLIPDLNEFSAAHQGDVRSFFLSGASREENARFASLYDIRVPILTIPVDESLQSRYLTRVTPFGFSIDEEGKVLGKGLVNSRIHLEVLFERPVGDPLHNNPSATEVP